MSRLFYKPQSYFMPRNKNNPVQTQMAVAVLDGAVNRQYNGCRRTDGKQGGRRRVFVQTDSGNVLSIELDRADNAHTVKKKMQVALNLPTEEASLTFGDLVLKNDLSAVINDAPLRLTRSSLHRSSSTPCLSPTIDNHLHKDKSGIVEIVGGLRLCPKIKKLVKAVVKGLEHGVEPVAVRGGLGGAYYFRNCRGENVAIVKPTDEEPFAPNNPKGFVGKALGQPGLKRSVRVGETGTREVAAYILDHDNFAKVPPTVLVKITHSIFNVNQTIGNNGECSLSKIASFQQFVPHDFDAADHGTSSFPVAAVHRIGILDIRVLNTDRHGGNLLVTNSESAGRYPHVGGELVDLVPIDHGLCLPENLEDPYFEWLHWPQASIPFSEDEMEYIRKLDPIKDAERLRRELPMIRDACLRVLVLCTMFLKMAAEAGLCLAEIGSMMSREFHGMEEEPSELELICIQAKMEADKALSLKSEDDLLEIQNDCSSEQFQFEMDCEELEEEEENDGYNNKKSLIHLDQKTLDKSVNMFPIYDSFSPGSHFLHSLLTEHSNHNMFKGLGGCPKSPFSANCHSPRTPRGCCRNPLSKLDENPFLEGNELQETDEVCKQDTGSPNKATSPITSGLSASLRTLSLKERNQAIPQRAASMKTYSSQGMSTVGGARSGHEQATVTVNYVKFSDMTDEEWSMFISCFQELLPAAFASRKMRNLTQRQRLGTSCQF